jgi:hypothetical protein
MTELKDDEILEYLMTSDLNENLRTQDYKYLIFKFRYFYKSLYGSFQNYKIEREAFIKDIQSISDNLNKEKYNLQVENADLKNQIDLNSKPRKLTWKERLSGKIDLKKQNNI